MPGPDEMPAAPDMPVSVSQTSGPACAHVALLCGIEARLLLWLVANSCCAQDYTSKFGVVSIATLWLVAVSSCAQGYTEKIWG